MSISPPPNLFEMMREAGERERLIAQGRLLGLSDEQARLVVETLGPAAMAGLQRAQADAGTVMQGLTQMGTRMMEDAAKGVPPVPSMPPAPPSPAASVFGSPAAADAVADRIASMTGVDRDAMRQLVPAFSASVLAQMAVMASLPALAPMRQALEGAMAQSPMMPQTDASASPKPSDPGTPPRQPDAADMMAPVTQFMQGLTAMMGTAFPTPNPNAMANTNAMSGPGTASPVTDDATAAAEGPSSEGSSSKDSSPEAAAPSLAEAMEAQTRAWNAFLSGLAKDAAGTGR